MTLVCDSGVTLSLLGVTGLTIVFKSKKGQGFLSAFRLRDVKSKPKWSQNQWDEKELWQGAFKRKRENHTVLNAKNANDEEAAGLGFTSDRLLIKCRHDHVEPQFVELKIYSLQLTFLPVNKLDLGWRHRRPNTTSCLVPCYN